MKKFFIGSFLFVGLFLFTACGHSMIQTLTDQGGTWEADGFGVETELYFVDEHQVIVTEEGRSYPGEYHYEEDTQRLTISLSGISATILTDVIEKDGMIQAKNNKKSVSFTRIEQGE